MEAKDRLSLIVRFLGSHISLKLMPAGDDIAKMIDQRKNPKRKFQRLSHYEVSKAITWRPSWWFRKLILKRCQSNTWNLTDGNVHLHQPRRFHWCDRPSKRWTDPGIRGSSLTFESFQPCLIIPPSRLLPLVASLLTSVHSVLPEQTFVLSDVTSVLSRVTSVRSRVTIFSNILGPLFCHVKAVHLEILTDGEKPFWRGPAKSLKGHETSAPLL